MLQFYNDNAEQLAEQYLSKPFEAVHHTWSHLLPSVLKQPQARILDIGAGAGRDTKYMAEQALALKGEKGNKENDVEVYAVEPARILADIGAQTTTGLKVHWLEDSLPALSVITQKEISFDLILLSAVWMHIPPSERARAIRKLANLLKPGGKLVISLRHSQDLAENHQRSMHLVCADELKSLAQDVGLATKLESQKQSDALGREHLVWQTLVFELPDDGTGAFPFIRHVALNDGKSATHKLALLRVLLRIADGHFGAVLRRESHADGDKVVLPLGLVALYWCHQYKDLTDEDMYDLHQTPQKDSNLGFMKEDGWHALKHLKSHDYRIGNLFVGDDAIALHKTLSHAASNICEMPASKITYSHSSGQKVFSFNKQRVKAKESLFLDLESLTQWGEFYVPEKIWQAFNRYACWIEPLLVSEWVKTMASYKGNEKYKAPKQQYPLYIALNWLDAKHSTGEAKSRCNHLMQNNTQACVWSHQTLQSNYHIDHCLPFTHWPNNDLWNLLPANAKINLQKSDLLPTKRRLEDSQDHIQDWWQQAWLTQDETSLKAPHENRASTQDRFFAEANLALPGIKSSNRSIGDVFEALLLQRSRLKEMQQLRDW